VRGVRTMFWVYLGVVLVGVAYAIALGLMGR
jgi:hypothetical protein